MDVFDSGVWVWGLTEEAPEAADLVQNVVEGNHWVAINSYIHGEVTRAFDRATNAGDSSIREAKANFNLIISKRHNVDFVDHEVIRQMDIEQVRRQQTIQLLGLSWGIQPKDVPIVLLADATQNQSTIYTTDESFSEFDTVSAGLTDVSMVYIPPR